MKRNPVLAMAVMALVATGWTTRTRAAGDPATTAAEAAHPADDTGRNARDADGTTLTADKQPNTKADVNLTQRIRQALVKDDSLSTSAHNVKIITVDGVVTLRGPVVSAEERASVAATAEKVAGVKRVDNQLEIASR